MQKLNYKIIIYGSAVLLLISGGYYFGKKSVDTSTVVSTTAESKQFKKLTHAFDIIANGYVNKPNKESLVEGAIKGMVASLHDPYSVYMDKKTADQFTESLDDSFQGIGAEVTAKNGKIVVVSPFKGSPAETAGLQPGDVIVSVDGKPSEGLTVGEVVSRIRGKEGTSVRIGIIRNNETQPILIDVKRNKIPIYTVQSEMISSNNKEIGYIQITQFNENTDEEFVKSLNNLEEKKLQGLVIDVRGNPGGYLTSVERILDQFVTKDEPYIQIEDRNKKIKPYFTHLKTKKPYPIAVLIDEGSASAAEILAAAMSETEKYPLFGTKTFGKGTVQQAIDLGDGSEIKMTFFKWLTPTGKWIHKKGIQPTYHIYQPDYFSLVPFTIHEKVRKDEVSTTVKHLQENLIASGFSPGRQDGYFDDQTELAVMAFQREEGLVVTGVVDETTASRLREIVSEKAKNPKNDLQLQAALIYVSK